MEACSTFSFHIFVLLGTLVYAILALVMNRLSNMSLISNFTIAKDSKCHTYVQSKQHRKPHKVAEERHLSSLELIHSGLFKMNGVLTKSKKRYFMILIDDVMKGP